MIWITFTLIAVFLWACINVADKIIMGRWVSEPLVPVTIGVMLGSTLSFVILLVKGFEQLAPLYLFLAIISGGFYLLMGYFYYKAVCVEEISRIIPLFYVSNIIIAIFAGIFLGEVLSPLKYLAMFVILIGAILVSTKELKAPKLDKGTLFMLVAAGSAATSMLLNKFVLGHVGYWTVFSLNRIGGLTFLVPILIANRKKIIPALAKTNKIAFGLFAVSSTVNLVALGLFTVATSIGLVTVVTGLTASQPVIVFILSVLLSFLIPKIIKEDTSRKVLVQKSIAIALIILGASFLI